MKILYLTLVLSTLSQDTLRTPQTSDEILVDTLVSLLPENFDFENFYQEYGRGGISIRNLQDRIESASPGQFTPLIFSPSQIDTLESLFQNVYSAGGVGFARDRTLHLKARAFHARQRTLHANYLKILAEKVGIMPAIDGAGVEDFVDDFVHHRQFEELQEEIEDVLGLRLSLDQRKEKALHDLINNSLRSVEEIKAFQKELHDLRSELNAYEPSELKQATKIGMLNIEIRSHWFILEREIESLRTLSDQNRRMLENSGVPIKDMVDSDSFKEILFKPRKGVDAIDMLRDNHVKYKNLSSVVIALVQELDELIIGQESFSSELIPVMVAILDRVHIIEVLQSELSGLLRGSSEVNVYEKEQFRSAAAQAYMKELIDRSTQTEEYKKIASQQNIISWLTVAMAVLILIGLGIVLYLFRQKIAHNKEISNVVNAGGQMLSDICSPREKILDIWKTHKIEYYLKDKFAIGGDFFWVHQNQRYKYLLIGDSEGHGMQGGVVTAYSVGILNALIHSRESKGLMLSGKGLLKDFTDTVGVMNKNWFTDMGLLVYDRKTKVHAYYGTLPLYCHYDGKLVEVKTGVKNLGLAKGFIDDTTRYRDKLLKGTAINVPQGTNLVIASDGYSDQAITDDGKKMKKLGKKNFKNILTKGLVMKSPREVKSYLEKELEGLVHQSKSRTDDNSFVCLQIS